jgi:uncharacterized protein
MTLTNLLVPTYTQMLKMLSGWLIKAQAQLPKEEAEALLSARLAPDMFPLSTQIRFACLQVQEAVFRLRGDAFPQSFDELVNEGRNAREQPGSIAEAQARIDETIILLESVAPDALDGDPDRAIAHEIPNGMIFDLTAEQYARDWTLPQFYFHLMTAYAILRGEGVELGKADYVTHMFQYVRPETMPKG